jgi:hypothetical protein
MQLTTDIGDLRPVIEAIATEVLARIDGERLRLNGRLAYSEAEAAAILGVRRHVLRDARLRGEVAGSRVGKRVLYERDELIEFLRRKRSR